MKCFNYILALVLALLQISTALRIRKESFIGLHGRDVPPLVSGNATSRIVGGGVAAEGSAPWQVSLQTLYHEHFCGGAIIDEWHVLTAASCVAGMPARNLWVVAGSNTWEEGGRYHAVENITHHCNFDKPLYHNDIALLRVARKFAIGSKTQSIQLAEEDDLRNGDNLYVTGWGKTAVDQLDYSPDLKKLEVAYVSESVCKLAYNGSTGVDQGHLCTLALTGEGFCYGDGGGPLVDAKGRLVGLGNWGVPCARGFPDVYARLSFYNDWVRTQIQGCRWL